VNIIFFSRNLKTKKEKGNQCDHVSIALAKINKRQNIRKSKDFSCPLIGTPRRVSLTVEKNQRAPILVLAPGLNSSQQ
jgi:hypothetical protein